MFSNILKFLNKITEDRYLEKVKLIILKLAYSQQRKTGNMSFVYDGFDNRKELKPYLNYDYSLYEKAVKELINEGKIIADYSNSPFSFSLTDSTSNDLSENIHPVKKYIKNNLLAIIDLILILISIIVD